MEHTFELLEFKQEIQVLYSKICRYPHLLKNIPTVTLFWNNICISVIFDKNLHEIRNYHIDFTVCFFGDPNVSRKWQTLAWDTLTGSVWVIFNVFESNAFKSCSATFLTSSYLNKCYQIPLNFEAWWINKFCYGR